ncbi:protein kinase domain-containing protein [Streptomyces sp. NPDC054863]
MSDDGAGRTGQWIGGYELTRRLGAGGMGEVYLGRDREGRQAAVKLVHAELVGDPEFRARFRQEVAAAGRVLSFFTVPLVGADPEGDPPWLATQYVPGPSLSDAVAREGPLPYTRLCTLAAALGEALVVVHGSGIVHRDLKPSNVLLAEDGPRVIDFGIARAADATALTGTGLMIGTFGYASPEHLTGSGPVTPAADVFSLGAVLLYAATGRQPFGEGPGASVAYRTVHEEPELDGVPGSLRALVAHCLAKDPAARPAPREVIAQARAAQSVDPDTSATTDAEPTSYRLNPPHPPSVHTAGADCYTPTAPGHSAVAGTRRRSVTLVGAAAALALVALAAFLLPRLWNNPGGGSPKTPTPTATRAAPAPALTGPASDTRTAVEPAGARRELWKAKLPAGGEERRLTGGWLDAKAAVRHDQLGAHAFDARTGRTLWALAPPPGLKTCAVSAGPSALAGGIGAVRYGPDGMDEQTCDRVGAVDTRTGKLLWHRRVGAAPGMRTALGMAGTALVARGDGAVVGLDPRTGREVWRHKDGTDGCFPGSVLVGPRTVVLLQSCAAGGAGTGRADRGADTVRELDARNGRTRWRHTLKGAADIVTPVLLSTEPVTVGLGRGGNGSKDSLLVLDLTGSRHHELPKEGSYGLMTTGRGEVDGSVLTEGDLAVVQVRATQIRDGRMLGLDTVTGRIRWQYDQPHVQLTLLSLDRTHVAGVAGLGFPNKDVALVRNRLTDGAVDGKGTVPYTAEPLSGVRVTLADGRRVVQFVSVGASRVAAVAFG